MRSFLIGDTPVASKIKVQARPLPFGLLLSLVFLDLVLFLKMGWTVAFYLTRAVAT